MNPMLQYPPTLMVVIASIFSAVVVTACGPEEGDPAVVAAAVQAASGGAATRQRPAASSHLGQVRGIDPVTEEVRPTGGGAVAGHQIEKHRVAAKVVGYDVQVRLDNGEVRGVRLQSLGGLSVGDRVDTEGGRLRRI